MERLTFGSDGYYAISNDNCYEDQNEDYCGPAIDRLAAYEETGLEPEEITNLITSMDAGLREYEKFTEAVNDIGGWGVVGSLVRAHKDERLVVLPCKVGQSVWFIETTLNVYTGETTREIVERVVTDVRGNKYNPVWFLAEGRDFHPTEIGRTVLLTRAEAEAALKEEQR